MKLRVPILVLAAAALIMMSASPSEARCTCRHRVHRTSSSTDYAYVSVAPVRYATPYRSAWIKTDVEPDEARVYLDGRYVGTADDYDGFPRKLRVASGTHRLTFRLHGYAPYSVVVHAAPGRVVDVDYWLKS